MEPEPKGCAGKARTPPNCGKEKLLASVFPRQRLDGRSAVASVGRSRCATRERRPGRLGHRDARYGNTPKGRHSRSGGRMVSHDGSATPYCWAWPCCSSSPWRARHRRLRRLEFVSRATTARARRRRQLDQPARHRLAQLQRAHRGDHDQPERLRPAHRRRAARLPGRASQHHHEDHRRRLGRGHRPGPGRQRRRAAGALGGRRAGLHGRRVRHAAAAVRLQLLHDRRSQERPRQGGKCDDRRPGLQADRRLRQDAARRTGRVRLARRRLGHEHQGTAALGRRRRDDGALAGPDAAARTHRLAGTSRPARAWRRP